MPENYLSLVNKNQRSEEEYNIENSITKGNPFGDSGWVRKIVKDYGLEQTLRIVGRPKNGG